MNCIDDFFDMVVNDCERNALSRLDHKIQYSIGLEGAMELLKENVCDKYDVKQKHKVYIAGLTEYIYHQCGKEPPEWVYEKQFYLDEPTFSDDVEKMFTRFNNDNLRQIWIEEAIPEFKKRNLMIDDVLSAV